MSHIKRGLRGRLLQMSAVRAAERDHVNHVLTVKAPRALRCSSHASNSYERHDEECSPHPFADNLGCARGNYRKFRRMKIFRTRKVGEISNKNGHEWVENYDGVVP